MIGHNFLYPEERLEAEYLDIADRAASELLLEVSLYLL